MNKNIIKLFAVLMMCFLIGSVLVACGSTNAGEEVIIQDGKTPSVTVGEDGYLYIDGEKTVKVEGTDGKPGQDLTDCTNHDYNIYDGEHVEANIVVKDGNKWEIKSHAHDCVPSIVDGMSKEATCTEGGYDTFTCECPRGILWVCVDCGDAKFEWTEEKTWKGNFTETIPHNYDSKVTEATCLAGGFTTHTCTMCGDTYKDSYTGTADHKWGEWGRKIYPEGTCPCTVPVEENRFCTVEGCTAQDVNVVSAATGHIFTNEDWEPCAPDTISSPCEQVPKRVRYCDNCGDDHKEHNQMEPVPGASAKGHDWGEWTVVTKPTADTAGQIKRVCSKCGTEYTSGVQTEELPKLDKVNYTHKILSDPTCTEGGKEQYTYKKYDNIVIVVDLEANGHNYTNGKTTNLVKPSYPANEADVEACTGSVDVICDVCGEKKNVEIPALTKATGRFMITVGNCLTPKDKYSIPLNVDGFEVFVTFEVVNPSYVHDDQPSHDKLTVLNGADGTDNYLGYWCNKCEHWILVEKVED